MEKNKKIDCCFLIASSSKKSYQKLSETYSAIEPPTWALLLAQSCRSLNYKVSIIDANAEDLNHEEVFDKVVQVNPKVLCLVVYGQNVNAGTANMRGAVDITNFLREKKLSCPIAFIGSHVQALPVDTLKKEKNIDIVFTNEAVYALRNLLKIKNFSAIELSKIKGIAYRDNHKVLINLPEKSVPTERMDIDLPGYAWDLLPYKKTPFDLYRAPMWHAEYDFNKR